VTRWGNDYRVQMARESSVRQPALRSYLVHCSGKDLDSKTVTVTAPVNSLEAFLILGVWQGERESTGGSELTMQ
jgi:hypothetical protein